VREAFVLKPLLVAGVLAISIAGVTGQEKSAPPAMPSDADIERFLSHAKVLHTKGAGKGITGSLRATLSDGTMTHDAQIQSFEEYKEEFASRTGTERNFRDSWSYNVAAYHVDRLIGLNMVPVSVSRRWGRDSAAFTWWVDNVKMDEEERLKKNIRAPDTDTWNQQMQLVRVFDQLIGNTDRNLGNLLITDDWRIWPIDHTRGFSVNPTVRAPENVTRCDRQVLEKIKALDRKSLQQAIGRYTYTTEITALLARRDAIVKILEKAGPGALFDRK
jgi:hypothetical protein